MLDPFGGFAMNAAEAYERHLVPHIFQPWTEFILRRSPDLRGLRILDAACGTGIVARLAARAAGPEGQVTGLDIDPAMLAVAVAQAQPAGAAPIRWVEASALAMPFPDDTFDIVFSLEGTQFFPDRVSGLAEIHRVLAPGGRLVTTNWGALPDNPGYRAISDGLRIFVSEAAARLPPFGLADPDEIARIAHAAGYRSVSVEAATLILPVPSARDFIAWIAAGAPTARHNIAQLSDDRREEFLRFVEDRLAPHAALDGTLRLPSMRHVLTATR
jgi:SAM-dependent methyltransferase